MATVLVTGAAGFVGAAAVRAFAAAGWSVRAAVRAGAQPNTSRVEWRAVGDIAAPHAWDGVTRGVDCVVHAAARVHIRQDRAPEARAAFHDVNVAATRRLALQAASDGVRRFVFVSSIGVNGTRTGARGYSEADPPQPHNAYSKSKLEAEHALFDVARDTGLEVVVLRPPLVYGRDAPGNFRMLAKWIARGWPLPFGAIDDNRRSVVFIENLTDAMRACATDARAVNKVFLVADGEPVSTAQLVRAMAAAMRRPSRLWNVPKPLLERAADAVGALRPLLDSLVIDTARLRHDLGWTPPYTLEQGLEKTFAG
ncbi:MAG TPA: NAD-dependent epimerase/dehydratase family protein [Burkholderiales bacterium]|nr:NAD-dependent epimerase/dehydratase family protein [Burkholderiales bacterium]